MAAIDVATRYNRNRLKGACVLKFLKRLLIVLLVATVAILAYRHVFNGTFPWDSFQFSRTPSSLTTQDSNVSPGANRLAQADPQRDFAYSTLSSDDRALYTLMFAGISNHTDRISITSSTADNVYDSYEAVRDDHPELFWVDAAYTRIGRDERSVIAFVPHYTLGADDAEQERQVLEGKADAFLATLDAGASEYDKALAIHDFVVENTTYDQTAYEAQDYSSYTNAYNLIGVLVDHTAVCEGYARTYQYLMQREGLYCAYVTGTATTALGTDNHAWNMVRIDGVYSFVDCTEDDPIMVGGPDIVDHTYFCVSTETLLYDHTPDKASSLPHCVTISG